MYRGSIISILLAACILLSVPLQACPDKVYLGLYADGNHSDCDVDVAAYSPITLWVWVLPSTSGVDCLEFRLEKPEWLQEVDRTPHFLCADLDEDFDWQALGESPVIDDPTDMLKYSKERKQYRQHGEW